MKSLIRSVMRAFLSFLLSVVIVKAQLVPQVTCPVNIRRNQVLNLTRSDEVYVLGGFHKDTLEDCIAGCCQEEWKMEDANMRGHCNLVTFYEHEDPGVMNCFMVKCITCVFETSHDFSYVWVHKALQPDSYSHLAFEELDSFPSHNALPPSFSLHHVKQSYISMESAKYTSLLDVIKNAISWSRGTVSSSVERIKRGLSRREDASKAKVEPAVEKEVVTPASSPKDETESPVSESQPAPSPTSKPSEKLETSVKTSEGEGTSATTKPVEKITENDDTVTNTSGNPSESSEANQGVTQGDAIAVTTPSTSVKVSAVTTPSTGGQVSSTTDDKAHSTTEASPEEPKVSTSAKPPADTGTTTATNQQKDSTTVPNSTPSTVSATKAVNKPSSQSTPKPDVATSKPESTSKTGSSTKSVPTTPKLELTSSSKTTPSQKSVTSTKASSTASSSADDVSTEKPGTTLKQEPVSQEKTTSVKQQSTSKSHPEIVPSEAASESLTETQASRTSSEDFFTDETVTAAGGSAGSKDSAVFTFETNNFVLILSLVLGVVLVMVVAVVLGKRWYEAYQRRHYNKVDYLINGMYS